MPPRRPHHGLLSCFQFEPDGLRTEAPTPDILTCPGSILTIWGPRFDVEAEGERGFGDGGLAGVELVTQSHQGFGVAWGTELAEMDVEVAVG